MSPAPAVADQLDALRVDEIGWPLARLAEGMEELARRAGLDPVSEIPLDGPETAAVRATSELSRWMEWAGARLGIEAAPVEITLADFDAFAACAGPSILQLDSDAGPRFVLLMGSSRSTLQLLGPDLTLHRCRAESLRAALCRRHSLPIDAEIDRVLDLADLSATQRSRARMALTAERLAGRPLCACWMLRLAPTAGFWRQLVRARVPRRLAAMLGVFGIVYGLEIVGWSLIGHAALSGRLDLGWMTAWVLLVLTLVPLGLLGGWLNATLTLDSGRILKRRLLAGALRLDPDSVRHQGAGQLLSRVMEAQALDALALNGGLSVLVAVVELVLAASVLALGAGGIVHVVSLIAWLAVSLWLGRKYVLRMQAWTLMRLDMTHELIERMVGHRTTLAQEWPGRRDARQDAQILEYLQLSRRMDVAGTKLFAGVPGGWGLIGLAGLAPAFVSGAASPASLAIAFGGLLLATRAFSGISGGITALASAFVAWKQAGPMFRAGAGSEAEASFLTARQMAGEAALGTSTKIVDANQIVLRHQANGPPVLEGVDLTIARGERLLLEGPSGGGKSTLASLLVGLRRPDSGLLLLNGLDRHTLGSSWQRIATEAPQFHENHVFGGTLGFNLLMGHSWPATEEDLEEAKQLCVELGLGDLLARMPSGMMQMVGETGWQLSHGERSRLFLARALLQGSQLTIMDESFAALDPATLAQCLDCVCRRARTLMVIAHP